MDEIELTADRLPSGAIGRVIKLNAGEPLRRRLLELGVIPGAQLRRRHTAPAGSPIAFEVGGALLSLRRADAAGIVVRPSEAPWTE